MGKEDVIQHPDKESYNNIWDRIIEPYLEEFKSIYTPEIDVSPFAKDIIWNNYTKWNALCKNRYMKDPHGLLDRHKVAACYLIAIATAKPMRFPNVFDNDIENEHIVANELLAISVGFSVLRAYIESAIHQNRTIEDEERERLLDLYKSGIVYPGDIDVNHGDYITNYASEIYYAIEEGSINLLSISHELFLLELYTKYR